MAKKRVKPDLEKHTQIGLIMKFLYDISVKLMVDLQNNHYPRNHKVSRKLDRLYHLLSELKSDLDDDCCDLPYSLEGDINQRITSIYYGSLFDKMNISQIYLAIKSILTNQKN